MRGGFVGYFGSSGNSMIYDPDRSGNFIMPRDLYQDHSIEVNSNPTNRRCRTVFAYHPILLLEYTEASGFAHCPRYAL